MSFISFDTVLYIKIDWDKIYKIARLVLAKANYLKLTYEFAYTVLLLKWKLAEWVLKLCLNNVLMALVCPAKILLKLVYLQVSQMFLRYFRWDISLYYLDSQNILS